MTPLPPPVPPWQPYRRRARRFVAGSAAVIGAGAVLAVPAAVLAQDDDEGGWLSDTLQELVEEGTITSDQADAVEDAIEETRPERGPGWFGHHRGGGFMMDLDRAAEALGVDVDELRDALRDGQSIADIAAEQGIDVQEVIDALVAAIDARLDEAVADGDLDAAEAEEKLAALTERITTFVEDGFDQWFPGGLPDHFRGGLFMDLDRAAEALGIEVDELRDALRDGQSIADIAAEQGIDVQEVIDALVAAIDARLDEAVADGDLDAAEAEEKLAALTERITTFVEQGFDEGLPGGLPGFPGFPHRHDDDRDGVDTDDGTPTTEDTTVTTIAGD